jgi:four helix bundle protein
MGVQRFEDLLVWQEAKALSDEVGRVLRGSGLRTDFALGDQLNRAVLSTLANIAEGFVRGGESEFVRFLRIAAGSNGEVRALLYAAEGRGYLPKTESDPLVERTNVIGRMLRKLMESLRAGSTKHHRPGQELRTKNERHARRTTHRAPSTDPKD